MTAAHALAHKDGLATFQVILACQDIWRGLTKAQRAALLFLVPADAGARVCRSLREKGLLNQDDQVTALGGAVVRFRPGGSNA